jgi:hypothetical protein
VLTASLALRDVEATDELDQLAAAVGWLPQQERHALRRPASLGELEEFVHDALAESACSYS